MQKIIGAEEPQVEAKMYLNQMSQSIEMTELCWTGEGSREFRWPVSLTEWVVKKSECHQRREGCKGEQVKQR